MRYKSRLDTRRDGSFILVVYYHPDLKDWDKAIACGIEQHGLDSCTKVFALPWRDLQEEERNAHEIVDSMFEDMFD